MNRPGDSNRRQNDMQMHPGRITMNSTGFATKRKPSKVNKEGMKGGFHNYNHKPYTNSQKSSQILVPIPGKYKNTPQRTDIIEGVQTLKEQSKIENSVSSLDTNSMENTSTHQLPANPDKPVSTNNEQKDSDISKYSEEERITIQAREQEDAELIAIQKEQTLKQEDEKLFRQMEVAQVANHRKKHYGNARVVNNNPRIGEQPPVETLPKPTVPKEQRFVKHYRKEKVKVDTKPVEVHKEGEFVLSGEDLKQVQVLLNVRKHMKIEPFKEVAEGQFNFGVVLDEEPTAELPSSSLQGFATDLTSSQSSMSPAGQGSVPGVATPMMPVQPSPQSNYVIPMNQMYPGITYLQPVYTPDFYIDYVWPQQGLTWTIPSGIPPSYAMPGQQYPYTMPPTTNESSA